MSTLVSITAPAQGALLATILGDFPVDPASIFTLVLLVGSFGAVLWFGSRSGGKGGAGKS